MALNLKSFIQSRASDQMCFLCMVVILIWIIPQSQSHISTLMKDGDLRPPIHRNHIIRVSRGPNIPSSAEDDGMSSPSIKSPPYQLRFRPGIGRLSQLHGYSVLPGRAPSSNGLNILNIPGIGRSNQGQLAQTSNQQVLKSMNEIFPLDSDTERDEGYEQPTFTPYIGARALSNMEKFFHHLRENIHALREEAMERELNSRLEEQMRDASEESDSDSSPLDWDDSTSSEAEIEMGAGGSPNNSPYRRNGLDASLGLTRKSWQPPASASGILHGQGNVACNGHCPNFPGSRPSSRLNTRTFRYVPSVTSAPIIPFSEDPELKRANNFNPSWMWTNLGLGKK